MTKDEILELFDLDLADPASDGRLRAIRVELDREDPQTPQIRRLVDEMLAAPTREPALRPSPSCWNVHPDHVPPDHPAPLREP